MNANKTYEFYFEGREDVHDLVVMLTQLDGGSKTNEDGHYVLCTPDDQPVVFMRDLHGGYAGHLVAAGSGEKLFSIDMDAYHNVVVEGCSITIKSATGEEIILYRYFHEKGRITVDEDTLAIIKPRIDNLKPSPWRLLTEQKD